MSTTATLSDEKRKLLDRFLRQRLATPTEISAISRRSSGTRAPLAPSQEQVIIRAQNASRPGLYNESITLKFKQPMNRGVLQSSMAEMMRRHEILRTHYEAESGQLIQIVDPAPDSFTLPLVDLRRSREWQRKADIVTLSLAQTGRPFDLERGPLLRSTLVAISDSEYWLEMAAHQSIIDGISVYRILPEELFAIYRAFAADLPSPLPELPLQFADFACWHRASLTPSETERQLAYWRAKLEGETRPLYWPGQKARPAKRTYRGFIREFTVDRRVGDAAGALSRSSGSTTFAALLAAFYSLLHFYTAQTDLVLGTFAPCGRKRSEVQPLIGYFLNPVALRVDLKDDPPFLELVHRAQIALSEALSHDDVPFEHVVAAIDPPVDASRNPFFDVAISLQPCMPDSAGAWSVTSMDAESGAAVLDLYIAFIDRPDGLHVRAQYNPDIFDFERIRQTIKDFEAMLAFATEHPHERISRLHT